MEALTREEQQVGRHLLFVYDLPGGWRPGSFSTHLIHALTAADPRNRQRLLRAYPEYRRPLTLLNEGPGVLRDALDQKPTSQ